MTPKQLNSPQSRNKIDIPPEGDDEKRLWLQNGWPLNFDLHGSPSQSSEEKARRTIQAVWLEEMAASANYSLKVKIEISNAIIEGPLNLKYTNFEYELSIVNSEFIGPCDFSFTNFHQNANFLASKFHQSSTFRNSQAKCDFIITRAQFLSDAQFIEMGVAGFLKAEGASFQDADFTMLKVTSLADFNPIFYEDNFIPVTFHGKASFYGAEFLTGASFRGAQFTKLAKFESISVSHIISSATFEKDDTVIRTYLMNANFNKFQCKGEVFFMGVLFDGITNFELAQIKGTAMFSSIINEKEEITTSFNGDAYFSGTSFGYNVNFKGVQFLKKTHFNKVTVNGLAMFDSRYTDAKSLPVKFGDDVMFTGTHFIGDAFFNSANFMQAAIFNDARFLGDAFFTKFKKKKVAPPNFHGRADFIGTFFGGEAYFDGAQFYERVSFFDAHFNRRASFKPVELDGEILPVSFTGKANFMGAQIKGIADFAGAQFKSRANFIQCVVENDLYFGPAQFGERNLR